MEREGRGIDRREREKKIFTFSCVCRNTVHRDLAARNILVHKHTDGSMQAKVADFGLSRYACR